MFSIFFIILTNQVAPVLVKLAMQEQVPAGLQFGLHQRARREEEEGVLGRQTVITQCFI